MVGKLKRSQNKLWKQVLRQRPELSCQLAGRFFGRMEDLLEQSEKTGYEHAVTFCANKKTGKVLATESCVGDVCSVSPPECGPNEEVYGYYHIHPSGGTEPSMADLNYSLFKRQRVECIGASEKSVYNNTEIPRTTIACQGFNVDDPKYESFRKDIASEAQEAASLGSKLVHKQYIAKQPMTSQEWKEYQTKKDSVLKKINESGLYKKESGCPVLGEFFGKISRVRVESAGKKKS